MDAAQNTILPFVSKARWMPDLGHPRWKRWYSTQTYLSESSAKLLPVILPSGLNRKRILFATRDYDNLGAAPARNTTSEIDLTTPAYMLTGTETDEALQGGDTLVGLDYYNPPLQMMRDIEVLQDRYTVGDTGVKSAVARVLAINHRFTFINYNKHPVEIYYAIVPTGFGFTDTDAFNTTGPANDLRESQYRKIVIPGVLDSGDKGVTKTLDIALSLPKLFPEAYMVPPTQVHNPSKTVQPENNSPWFSVRAATRPYDTCPPGQSTYNLQNNDEDQGAMPGLKMQLLGNLQTGVQVGSSSALSITTGTMDTNGVVVHARMNWLVDMVNLLQRSRWHQGSKAYPSQAV